MLILGCVCILQRFFQFIEEMGNVFFFEKPRLHFQIIPNLLKSLKNEIFLSPCLHILSTNGDDGLSVQHVASEEPIYDQISSFQEKTLIL